MRWARLPAAALAPALLIGCNTHQSTLAPFGEDAGEIRTLAAGVLPMTRADIAGFIRNPGKTKPGVRMPASGQMSVAEADQIARYLQALK